MIPIPPPLPDSSQALWEAAERVAVWIPRYEGLKWFALRGIHDALHAGDMGRADDYMAGLECLADIYREADNDDDAYLHDYPGPDGVAERVDRNQTRFPFGPAAEN